MEKIYEISERLVDTISIDIKRYLFLEIDWQQRLIGILGAKGTGKTTLMLQFIIYTTFRFASSYSLKLEKNITHTP
jgi:ABC-type uncharacterized transport system ATPase subunit